MKKYTAETMVEAMEKVREDFGEQAVIISSNVVYSKGFLGLFKKKSVEVVAGYDQPRPVVQRPIEPAVDVSREMNAATSQLKQEMATMKKMLETMQQHTNVNHYPNDLQPLLSYLQVQGLQSALIHEIGDEIFVKMKESKEDFTVQQLVKMAKEILLSHFEQLPFGGISFTKKFINVLGPTGVGKTTTIAKIAARTLLEKKKKVGFITTDTYRIAAIEQLRTYANLLQAPVEVVYNAADFKQAIENLKDVDHIFIDTAGRNYKEQKFVDDLNQMIDFTLEMEAYLVLSMTSKEEDMLAIIKQFTHFPVEKFIFTKMDETSTRGAMFNLMQNFQYGVAYYTNGQEVPEDLEEATAQKAIDLLMEDFTYERSS